MYEKAKTEIEKQFDIIEVFTALRKAELVSQVILAKYQKYFLPYLKNNVLNDNIEEEGKSQKKRKFLPQRFATRNNLWMIRLWYT